jgi:hypothetical protein
MVNAWKHTSFSSCMPVALVDIMYVCFWLRFYSPHPHQHAQVIPDHDAVPEDDRRERHRP